MVDDGEMPLPDDASRGEGAPSDTAVTEDAATLRAALAEARAENGRLRQALVLLQNRLLQHYTDADRIHRETIHLDEHCTNPAFHFVERIGPDRPFRWFGRERTAWFVTTIPRTRAVRVDLYVEVMIGESTLDALEVHADGVFATRTETDYLDNGAVRRSFYVPPPAEPTPHARLKLGLIAGERVKPQGEDDRLLAVGLSRIEITQLDDETFADAARWHRTLPAAAIGHPAFHPTERRPGDDAAYRWFGAELDAAFPVAPPPGRPVRVEAHLVHHASDAALADFRIAIGPRTATRYETTAAPDGTLVKAAARRGPGAPGDRIAPVALRLSLGTRHAIPSDDGTRQLGVALQKLVLREIDEDVFGGAGPFRRDIDVADIDHPAFYGLEHQPNGMYLRWLGQEDEAALAVDVPGGVPLRVIAEFVIAIDEAALEGLSIGLDGTYAQAHETTRHEDGRLLRSAVFAPLAEHGGTLRPATVNLRVAHKVDLSDKGDPRTLAVALRKIVIEAA